MQKLHFNNLCILYTNLGVISMPAKIVQRFNNAQFIQYVSGFSGFFAATRFVLHWKRYFACFCAF